MKKGNPRTDGSKIVEHLLTFLANSTQCIGAYNKNHCSNGRFVGFVENLKFCIAGISHYDYAMFPFNIRTDQTQHH